MNNILDIKDCFGCGVCSLACNKNIIDLRINSNGFYEPYITDISQCTQCKECINVCSFLNDMNKGMHPQKIKAYAAWSNNNENRNKCSSGGVAYELSEKALQNNYKVCGVRYNINKNRTEHYIALNIQELKDSIGSKYLQSYTINAFKNINKKEKYLIIGTPCQIASFKNYIQRKRVEDNFILIDFFCHGVPSYLLWEKYIKEINLKKEDVINIAWRDKKDGWHDSWGIKIEYKNKNTLFSKLTQGNSFYKLFLSNSCLNKCCFENCKYKYKSSKADIRLGDLWGNTFLNEEKGVSAVITYTEKGNNLFINSRCHFKELSFDEVAEGQIQSTLVTPPYYQSTFKMLKKGYDLKSIIRKNNKILLYSRLYDKISHPCKILTKIQNIIKNTFK